MARATKKVKDREKDVNGGEINMEDAQANSFREALLKVPGLNGPSNPLGSEDDEEELPENRWYREVEEPMVVRSQEDGRIPEIIVTDKELETWSYDWRLTLVVHVLGKKINYRMLESKVNRDWARSGTVKIIDLPRGFFAVHFESEEDYKHVLFEGPWMVADHYLLVQRWRPNFLNSARKESKVAVWIRVPELSLELYNQTFLKRLGGSLGTYLKMDRLTSIQSRGQFARFCVEIDLAKPLTPYVLVRGQKIKLEYEGLHSVCFKCGVYGHRMEDCGLYNLASPEMESPPVHSGEKVINQGVLVEIQGAVNQVVGSSPSDDDPLKRAQQDKQKDKLEEEGGKVTDVQGVIAEIEEREDSYGPWMLVKRGRKKKGTPSIGSKNRKAEQGGKGAQSQKQAETPGTSSRVNRDRSQPTSRDQGDKRNIEHMEYETTNNTPLVIFEDPPTKMDCSMSQAGEKVRSPTGGKNTQSGPSVREAKKLARSNGSVKLAFKVAGGPNGGKKKENKNPNVKGVDKCKLPISSGPIHPKSWSRQEKELMKECLKENNNVEARQDPPCNHPTHVEDPNPLLGFITPTNVTLTSKVILPSDESKQSGCLQMESKLSEQTISNVSP